MHRLLPFLGVVLAGCSSTDGFPRVRAHHTTTAGPLVERLHIEMDRRAAVTVDYWTIDTPRLRIDAGASRTHDIALTRLRANRTYHYRIAGTEAAGTFTTDALPPDLARIRLVPDGSPTTPLVLLHLFDPHGFRGYVAVDGSGEIVWYWRTVDMPFGAVRRANGHVVFMDRGRGLVEVRADGTVVRELAQDVAGREQHHDVIGTPADTLLFLAFDARSHAGTPLKGDAIWEWTPETGAVVRRWTSWDHFSPDRDRGPRFGVEWLHANSLALGPRGNVLVSVHFFNQVISISPDFERVEWRLGGVNATRSLAAADQYSGQHTAREIAANRLLVFDNGFRVRDSSRAIELELHPDGARPVWQWQPPRRNLSAAVGSARRLANGHTVVAFGMRGGLGSTGPIEVYEINTTGEAVWHLEVGDAWQMYRAEPWPSIGWEYADGEAGSAE